MLCLALLHHLVLTNGVPLPDALDWLASLGAHVVVEFVAPDDPMAERLIRAKRGVVHAGYDAATFSRLLEDRFDVRAEETLASGTRTLVFAAPRR